MSDLDLDLYPVEGFTLVPLIEAVRSVDVDAMTVTTVAGLSYVTLPLRSGGIETVGCYRFYMDDGLQVWQNMRDDYIPTIGREVRYTRRDDGLYVLLWPIGRDKGRCWLTMREYNGIIKLGPKPLPRPTTDKTVIEERPRMSLFKRSEG